jgi:uncharacterized protein
VSGLETLRERLARDGSLMLAVKVSLRAPKSEVVGVAEEGALKVRLAAIPEKGEANEELRRLLAGFFAVSKSGVQIVAGETARHKRVRIAARI